MKKRLVTLIVAVSAFATLTACGGETTAKNETTVESVVETTGETVATTETTAETVAATETTVETASEAHVEKEIVLEVVDNEGNSTVVEVETDAEYLYDAIQNVEGFSFDGYEADWGYVITTINDLYADYDNDGAYWSIYVNDEYGMYGVNEQPVTSGDTYSFKYEVYVAE